MIAMGVCIEGDALHWLQWREKKQPFVSCDEFKLEVQRRFPLPDERTPHEELMLIRQQGSVNEFRSCFKLLSVTVEGLTDETLSVVL